MEISLCLVVKDEERTLEGCLAPIHDLFDDIVVMDTGSSDRTLELLHDRFRVCPLHGVLDERFCFAKFEQELEAYFGHCGDARAKEVDLRAGFRETRVPFLLVRPNRPLTAERYETLLRQAEAIGAF